MASKIDAKIVSYEIVTEDQQQLEAMSMEVESNQSLPDFDPTFQPLDEVPEGYLNAQRWKGEYTSSEGTEKLYLIASFLEMDALQNNEEFTIERCIELFMPPSQRKEIQPWVSLAMKQASRALRNGTPAQKVISDFLTTSDDQHIFFPTLGGKKKKVFNSEVAVIGQAFANMLYDRGLLDENGYDVPVDKRPRKTNGFNFELPASAVEEKSAADEQKAPVVEFKNATRCRSCDEKAVVYENGCFVCKNCGESKCG